MYNGKGSLIIGSFIFVMMQFKAISQEDTVVSINEDTLVSPVYTVNDKMDFKTVESVSYNLYLNKDWKTLCIYGEKAVHLKIDYYYIRVRLGVAYFELKHYREATGQFKRALEFNAGDEFAMGYLYSCYLLTERFDEAKWLTRSFSPVLAESTNSNYFSAMDYVSVESGFKSVENTRFKDPYFFSAGLAHSIARRIFLFHNFSYYSQDESRFNVQQLQYYLRCNLPLKNNFLLAGGFHFVGVSSNDKSEAPVYSKTERMTQQGIRVDSTISGFRETLTLRKTFGYIGAFTLTKRLTFFDFSIGTTVANYDTTYQYQANAGVTFYPLKNNKISFGANMYYHLETTGNQSNIACAPFLNAYISSKIHLSISYLNNRGANITEATGYFVSNSLDYTTERWAFTASFKANSTVWVYGTYGYEKKRFNSPREDFRYYYHILAAGLKIIPQFK